MSDEVSDEVSGEVSPGLSDQYRKASPWPMLVALGFVISEVGVVLGFFPVTVGGLLLFGGTVAGILSESGYVERPWRSLVGIGTILLVLGVLAVGLNLGSRSLSADVLLNTANPVIYRGTAILVSALILLAIAAVFRVGERELP